jgi:hypothetical protein
MVNGRGRTGWIPGGSGSRSSLLNDLLMQRTKTMTGRYQSDYFTLD